MEPARVTQLLQTDDGRISWATHVALMHSLESLGIESVYDFQETLLRHLSEGSWVSTAVGAVVVLPGGATYPDRVSLESEIEAYRALATQAEVPEHTRAWLVSQLEEMEAWRPPEVELVVTVPDGHIGIPLSQWVASGYGRDGGMHLDVGRIVADMAGGTGYADVELLLLAAPWAVRRLTGIRQAGYPVSRAEELYDSGRMAMFTTSIVISKGADRVEWLVVGPDPSADFAAIDHLGSFRKFARTIGAKLETISAAEIAARPEERTTWGVEHGDIIAERPTFERPAPNALSTALAAALFRSSPDRRAHPLMKDAEFWQLIAPLADRIHEDSLESVTAALARRPKRSIIAFHETLALKLWQIDHPTAPATSDDVGLYHRCLILSRGEGAWSDARLASTVDADEDDADDGSGEYLLSIAPDAFERKVGEPLEHETEVSYETASNAQLWGVEPNVTGGIASWSIRSLSVSEQGTMETVRVWHEPDREAAGSMHDAAELERWGDAYLGIVDAVPLPDSGALDVTRGLARVSYYSAHGG